MTTLQKTLIAATVAVLAGAVIYENRQAAQLRDQVRTLRQEQAPLTEQIMRLQAAAADTTIRLSNLSAENARLKSAPHETERSKAGPDDAAGASALTQPRNAPAVDSVKSLVNKMDRLEQRFNANPDAQISELQLLTEADWAAVAKGKLETEADFLRAMGELRSKAESRFAHILCDALVKYSQANGNKWPTDVSELKTYVSQFQSNDSEIINAIPFVSDAMFDRWKIMPSKDAAGFSEMAATAVAASLEEWVITQKSVVDEAFDTRFLTHRQAAWGIPPPPSQRGVSPGSGL
jgi:hypothetical protein